MTRLMLLAIPALMAACTTVDTALPGDVAAAMPGTGAPVAVSFAAFTPAPLPLSEEVLASLPPGIPSGDVFLAPDGCYFFLQGEALMGLTRGNTAIPFCG